MTSVVDEYRARLRQALGQLEEMENELEALQAEPIAVVGVACRFPGNANSPDAYFELLENGVDAVTEVPAERWKLPTPNAVGSTDERAQRWGAFIHDIDLFDAAFFGISPREARGLDPQQRILLELSWEALERAGIIPGQLVGSRTGFFLGITQTDYLLSGFLKRPAGSLDFYDLVGNGHAAGAGRISYTLGLEGPCMAIDTACSSSLVATHFGCQSLRLRESDVVIAGGVNLILTSEMMHLIGTSHGLSPDGRCKTLDASANGFVRGEGAGIIVLKRLSDAQRDGNPILALIRGSAVNQDGRSAGIAAPNVKSQEAVLLQALENARLQPSDIGYIEMHGTGTPLGDPIEAAALTSVLGKPRANGSTCVLGAAKTNIAHLEAASGVAGFLKVVLAFERERIPQNLHFNALNPRISLHGTPFVIPTNLVPWPRTNTPRRAGVSSFGMTGTNAHVILEEAPSDESQPRPSSEASAYLLPLSAKNPQGLTALAQSYAEWFSERKNAALRDIVYTATCRRTHHEYRLATVARTREEFIETLRLVARGEMPPGVASGRTPPERVSNVVFVFPGQGSQWLGMGKQLLAEEPVFRAVIEAWDIAVQREAGFSILQQITADESHSRLHEIDVVQPLLLALEVALATLWRSWGIEPDCVVGHSMGEVAAAYVAGILNLDHAAKIICQRSRLLKRISGQGAMALVELPMADAAAALAGHETRVSVAVSNGPRSTVLSGDPIALEHVLANLEKSGVFCRRVKVDVASHSPQVDPLLSELLDILADVRPTNGQLKLQSTVTGKPIQGRELVASYWVDNLRQPVRFSQVTQDLIHHGHHVFIEVSPHPILLPSIEENLKWMNIEGAAIASMRRQTDEHRMMLESLGVLHTRGHIVDWNKLFPEQQRVVPLPAYPWQKERFWIDAPKRPARITHTDGEHPFLGMGLIPASQPQFHVWEQWVSVDAFPYLADHRVQGEVVFPGAGYVEMAFAAAKSVYGQEAVFLEHIAFEHLLSLTPDDNHRVQISLVEETGGFATITILSKPKDAVNWVQHASATARVVATSSVARPLKSRNDIDRRCPTVIESRAHYARMESHGLSYGPTFRGVSTVRVGENEALAQVRVPDDLRNGIAEYLVHPAMLDACIQATSWALQSAGQETFVPIMADNLRIYDRLPAEVWVHARLVNGVHTGTQAVTFSIYDENGRLLVEMGALQSQALDRANPKTLDPFANCIFDVSWRKSDLAAVSTTTAQQPRQWLVLLDSFGLGSTLAQQLRDRGNRVVEVVPHAEYARIGDNYRLNATDSGHWEKLLTSAFGKLGFEGILDCWALDGAAFQNTTEATLATDMRHGLLSALRLVQAVLKQGWRDVPRFYLLTRGAQAVEPGTTPLAVSQSMLWGLGRVIAIEQPDMGCVRIDLPVEASPDEPALVLAELMGGANEDQIAYRAGQRYVARLIRGRWETGAIKERRARAAEQPYRLGIREPGVLERLALRPMERRVPGAGEVEIEVEAAGLNFLDVLLAMGVLPDDVAKDNLQGPQLGGECAGRIVRIGEGVSDVEIGQEVIALAPCAMATHVIAQRKLVVAKPADLNWSDAATVPIVFSTAYHSLAHLARLQRGERVLIHAGAGGVGMAAIQWAQHVGAEVFATAGSEEKRALLRSLGVHHVMDSRSLSFVDDVRRFTNGEGVDVVLNSLSGKFLDASFELLRDHGRFIEIGKRDYYDNRPLGLRPFLKNLSFSLIDLRGMMLNRPSAVTSLLQEVMDSFAGGIFKPLPCSIFSIANAVEAFSRMAQGKHTGKLALTIPKDDPHIVLTATDDIRVRSDGTYLLTGGLGGLGLSLAGWMVQQGAKHLVLMGRSAPNAAAAAAIADMRAAGANVQAMQANVAHRADIDVVMSRMARDMPPLRGVVHAAAVLADRMLTEMSETEFFQAIDPKVFGAWNLHEATRNLHLDFFVMYSSASGLLGSPGQANYAAANTFLDGLSHARHAAGLPATSIQWGAFADVGLAAASEIRGKRLMSRGGASFKPAEGNELFGRIIALSRPELGVTHFDVRQWVEFYPQMADAPFITELMQEAGQPTTPQGSGFRDELEHVAPAQRLGRIETHLAEQLGKVLRLDPGRIDKRAPFASLGVDSLMSLELRNRLEASLGLKLSATVLFTYATTHALANHIIERLVSKSAPAEGHAAVVHSQVQNDFDEIAPDDVTPEPADEATLVDKLGEFEEFLK